MDATATCALAGRFLREGFEVAMADVLTPATAGHRRKLPDCLLAHLTATLAEAHRRAGTRAAT